MMMRRMKNYDKLLVTVIVLVNCFSFSLTQNEIEQPEVSIPLGAIKGSYMTTRLGKKIHAFRGLRYAEAPVGNLRFKLAVPAKPWNGVFNASEEGPSCFRPAGQIVNDDCLRLNVYTTKTTLPSSDTKKSPVIVFFHPGGFYGFSGQSYLFGPQYLLDEDIVLVTTNFRLGAIGFTATGDTLAPGNLGLKDQVEALRWVQKYIAFFNGDPSCVTIVGYSAGSWSTVLHMLSPMSRGLFHRVVAMSGSPTKGEQLAYEQKAIAEKQAKLVDCPSNSTKDMLTCFENVKGQKMAGTLNKFQEWHYDPIRIWSPVVEPNLAGVERFIVDEPIDLIRRGEFTKVPFLSGSTLDEFGGQAMLPVMEAKKGNNSIFEDLNKNWGYIAPIAFQYQRNTTRSKQISQELKSFYFKEQSIGLDNWRSLAHLYGDAIVTFPIRRAVDLISQYSTEPVYYYHFVYQGRYSYSVWPNTTEPFGVSHHDDLIYLFYTKRFFPFFDNNAPEIPTVEHMTAMWANFAKTGNPIPKKNPHFENVTWEPYNVREKNYLEINNTLTMKNNFYADRMAAFERIFPLPPLREGKDETC